MYIKVNPVTEPAIVPADIRLRIIYQGNPDVGLVSDVWKISQYTVRPTLHPNMFDGTHNCDLAMTWRKANH